MKRIIKILGVCILISISHSCTKKDTPPVLTTTSVTEVTYSSAISGGIVTSEGGDQVSSRGICWSTTSDPTLDNSITVDGSGLGVFVSKLIKLVPNTKYYVKAYAINSAGLTYGNQVTFTTLQSSLPSVTTTLISNITSRSATGGGDVTFDGGGGVTARGICWNISPNPTTNNYKSLDGDGTGVFNSNMNGLLANTIYYVRAFATNAAGTAYGNQVSLTTLSIGQAGTVGDIDGNIYNTIVIGNQTWMAENLRAIRYNDGTSIPLVLTGWSTTETPKYCYVNSYFNKYGALYNWYTVSPSSNGNKNICPVGWHVPNDDEWTEFKNYVIASGYNFDGTTAENKIGKSLSLPIDWGLSYAQGAVGNGDFPNKRNATGFSALPSCLRYSDGAYAGTGYIAVWWSSTATTSSYARLQQLYYNDIELGGHYFGKNTGASVRCIKD